MSLTISDSEPRRQYTGNGVQTAFSANFEFRAASDVVCNVDGVVKTLNVEGPGEFKVSDADTLLAQAKAL